MSTLLMGAPSSGVLSKDPALIYAGLEKSVRAAGRVARIIATYALVHPRQRSSDADGNRASKLQHAVEGMDGDGHLGCPTLIHA